MNDNYDKSLTAEHIGIDNYEYAEAARSGFFTFYINDLDGIARPDSADGTKTYGRAREWLGLHVVKAPVPLHSLSTLSYRRGNEIVKFAGVPSWDAGDITVDDVVGVDTKGILMAWYLKGYNVHTRKGGRMKDYKRLCTLVEYTQDYEPIREWTLYGCWISKLSQGEFDKENDDKRQISATIEYDRAEMTKDYTQNDAIEN